MRKILVTGATGYVGAHVVKKLAEEGYNVHGTDINLAQNEIGKYCSRVIQWDFRLPIFLIDTYDAIIHLGAATKVGPSVANPWLYYQTNVTGTKNVTDIAHDHFIYCSTGAAFQPEASPYGMTKYGGELITKQFCDNNTILRFYNVSGNDGMYKFDDDVYHLIRKAAKTAKGQYDQMSIFGTDYMTRDGTCVRNYTHVSDIVDGVVNAVKKGGMNTDYECLGSPEGYTVREVIDTMKEVSGVDFKVIEEGRRAGDIAVSTVPESSELFKLKKTLADQCRDALVYE